MLVDTTLLLRRDNGLEKAGRGFVKGALTLPSFFHRFSLYNTRISITCLTTGPTYLPTYLLTYLPTYLHTCQDLPRPTKTYIPRPTKTYQDLPRPTKTYPPTPTARFESSPCGLTEQGTTGTRAPFFMWTWSWSLQRYLPCNDMFLSSNMSSFMNVFFLL